MNKRACAVLAVVGVGMVGCVSDEDRLVNTTVVQAANALRRATTPTTKNPMDRLAFASAGGDVMAFLASTLPDQHAPLDGDAPHPHHVYVHTEGNTLIIDGIGDDVTKAIKSERISLPPPGPDGL